MSGYTSGNILSTKICKGACTAAADTLSTAEFTYDLRGRLLDKSVFEPDGPDADSDPQLVAQTRTAYDDLGRPVTNTVDPTGLQLLSQTAYDDRGRVIHTISPAGRITCLSYDSLDRLKETRQLSNAEAQNCSAGSFSEGDVVTKTEYDAMGRSVIETDAEGTKTYRWYDIYGQLEFVSDGKPDAASAPTFLGTPPALPSTFQWYSQTSHDLAGQAIRERFFGVGHEEEDVPRVFLRASWQEYDSLGRPTASHVGLAYLDVPEAEASSLTVPSPNPAEGFDLSTVRTYYDNQGKRRKVVDPEGRATTFDYDAFGRPKTTFLPTESPHPADTVLTEYDTAGRPRRTTTTIHDPENQPHTRVAEIAYDHWGRTLRTTGDPQGQSLITEFGYDVLGRTTTTVRRWWDPTPPGASQALGSINTHDRVVQVAYDAAGRAHEQRVRESENPDAWATTTLTYDGDGLMLSMKDAENSQTDFQYDPALGRLQRMLYPLEASKRQTIEYTQYNKRGQPTQVQYRADNASQAARVTRTMNYDNRGRLTSRTAVAENAGTTVFSGTTEQSFAYDDLGRMIRGTDHSPDFGSEQDIIVRFRYDSASRKVEENQLLPLVGGFTDHFVISKLDRAGFRTELVFPDHDQGTPYTINYGPDWRGRLSTIQAPTDPTSPTSAPKTLVNYEYVGDQVWERHYSNGTELRMYEPAPQGQTTKPLLYDGLGRPTAMQTAADSWGTRPALPDFRYGYDRVGNLMYEQRRHEITVSNPTEYRTRAYSTDLIGRLYSRAEGSLPATPVLPATVDPAGAVSSPSEAESWLLDLVGNWQVKTTSVGPAQTTNTFVRNPLNQYDSVMIGGSAKAFSHDWLGQLREDASKGKKYTWDLFGRLTKVEVLFQGTYSLQSRYRYDALNRRVETYIPVPSSGTDSTTRYIYDGWRNIEECAVVGDPQEEVVRARYGHGVRLDDVLWMDRDVPLEGSRFFVHHDFLGSAVAVTNDVDPEDATIVERFTYSAYGEIQAWHNTTWNSATGYGTPSAVSKVRLPFLYTGQRYDANTGLSYYKNRYYDPAVGRFLRRDLVGYADGPSLYQYAASNPSVSVDPLGLFIGAYMMARAATAGGGVGEDLSDARVRANPHPNRASGEAPGWSNEGSSKYSDLADSSCAGLGVQWKSCGEMRDYEARKSHEQGPDKVYAWKERWESMTVAKTPAQLVAEGATRNLYTGAWEKNGLAVMTDYQVEMISGSYELENNGWFSPHEGGVAGDVQDGLTIGGKMLGNMPSTLEKVVRDLDGSEYREARRYYKGIGRGLRNINRAVQPVVRVAGPLLLAIGAGADLAENLADPAQSGGEAVGRTAFTYVGGAVGGFVGGLAGTFGGPAAPLTVPAGAVAGGYIGSQAGEFAGDKIWGPE